MPPQHLINRKNHIRKKKNEPMIFKSKEMNFLKHKISKVYYFPSFSLYPNTLKQREIGWKMNQTHN